MIDEISVNILRFQASVSVDLAICIYIYILSNSCSLQVIEIGKIELIVINFDL